MKVSGELLLTMQRRAEMAHYCVRVLRADVATAAQTGELDTNDVRKLISRAHEELILFSIDAGVTDALPIGGR
jgi:hypothetical protein